jgi:hypothetical protein
MRNPIAKFSRIIGADLLSHLLGMSKKGHQPPTSPPLVTGIEGKNMSQTFFAQRKLAIS